MHPDDLKTIWECQDCGRKSFYHSDMSSHSREFGHTRIVSRDYARKKRDAVFVTKNISLSFRVEGKKAKMEVECKYYPFTESIVYTNVSYSSEKLQQMLENRPEMMSKVDSYLRKLFNAQGADNLRA